MDFITFILSSLILIKIQRIIFWVIFINDHLARPKTQTAPKVDWISAAEEGLEARVSLEPEQVVAVVAVAAAVGTAAAGTTAVAAAAAAASADLGRGIGWVAGWKYRAAVAC